jgi:hypothetical protein
MAAGSYIDTFSTVFFQQLVDGYAGVENIELSPCLDEDCPGLPCCRILVDLSNAGAESQGLLRFNNLFGNGSNQVPPGATILSAVLYLQATDVNADGDPVNVHRMLVPWSQSTLHWSNTFVAGIHGVLPDNVVARTEIDALIISKPLTVPFTVAVDVTRSIRAWADGAANYGWVLRSTGTDGFRFDASQLSTGPLLEIAYAPASPALTIANQSGSVILRWSPDAAWELVTSPTIEGLYIPVVGGPSGTFVIPSTIRTNRTAFFRLRSRLGMQ